MAHAKSRSFVSDLHGPVLALAICALAISTLASSDAGAALRRSGEEVIVEAHEVIADDLIVWGSYIRIDGIVRGDVVAIGQDLVVEGIIEGDLLAAAKTIYLNGALNDDARVIGYALAAGENARVSDDFFGLSYSLETKPGSLVGGALHAASRQALLAGQVAESVQARAGALALHGLTGGNVDVVVGGLEGVTHSSMIIDLAIEIPDVAEGLFVGDSARIAGDFDYRAEEAATISRGARIAGQTRHEPWRTQPATPVTPTIGDEPLEASDSGRAVRRLGVLLALGLVLALVFPGWSLDRASQILRAPLVSFGWGLGALILACVMSGVIGIVWLMLLVLIGGTTGLGFTITAASFLLQAAVIAPLLIALIYLAPVLTSLGVGHFALEKLASSPDAAGGAKRAAVTVAVGALIYALLRAAPGLGPVVGFFGALTGLGALALWLRERASLESQPGDRSGRAERTETEGAG